MVNFQFYYYFGEKRGKYLGPIALQPNCFFTAVFDVLELQWKIGDAYSFFPRELFQARKICRKNQESMNSQVLTCLSSVIRNSLLLE